MIYMCDIDGETFIGTCREPASSFRKAEINLPGSPVYSADVASALNSRVREMAMAVVTFSAVAVGQTSGDPSERNYRYCLSGSYTCNKGSLTPEQMALVHESDLRRNYNACTSGSYTCNYLQ